ncbi:MAG: hypothetical protein NZM34_04560 [Bernardetiaceae bacterium]|nr:hypothetical protein [Bernardetiaceae bacterium]
MAALFATLPLRYGKQQLIQKNTALLMLNFNVLLVETTRLLGYFYTVFTHSIEQLSFSIAS